LDKSPPKKERYVVYIDPELGLALRQYVAEVKSRTYSSVAEDALKKMLSQRAPAREVALAR
jgi:hypothetical protein